MRELLSRKYYCLPLTTAGEMHEEKKEGCHIEEHESKSTGLLETFYMLRINPVKKYFFLPIQSHQN